MTGFAYPQGSYLAKPPETERFTSREWLEPRHGKALKGLLERYFK
jgi:hypothetical protein